jgi:hypothetical protein
MILLSLFGFALMLSAWLVPAYFRAVDAQVVVQSGQRTSTLVDEAIRNLKAGMVGQARLLQAAAQQCGQAGSKDLDRALGEAAAWQASQSGFSEVDAILRNDPLGRKWDGQPVMNLLADRTVRQTFRKHLENTYRSGILEVVKTRGLTELRHFSPADSAAGQPYEAASLLAGLLVEDEQLPSSLRQEMESLAYRATRKNETQVLELFYLDLITLGNRMNRGQLVDVLKCVVDLGTLRDLANLSREASQQWQVLAGAVLLNGSAQEVTGYLLRHAQTGMTDLQFALRYGQGALHKLLSSHARIYDSPWRKRLLAYEPFYTVFGVWQQVANEANHWGLLLKYGLLVGGAFLLGRGLIDLIPAAVRIADKGWTNPAQWVVFGVLVISVFALCEPFLFTPNQMSHLPQGWKMPMFGEVIPITISNKFKPMNDPLTVISLGVFLVLQAIIYVLCLRKMTEIRRQQVPSRIKLKLLENEENLFDSGLYCGLGGTVASLVVLTLGIIKPGLMAAYASTLFGIIFVAVLKIFHLRPFRRRLIIDAELWNANE